LPYVPEIWLTLRSYGLNKLMADWSSKYSLNRLKVIEETFNAPGVPTAAVSYYRQNFFQLSAELKDYVNPRAAETQTMMKKKYNVRTLLIFGTDDGCMDNPIFRENVTVFRSDFPRGIELVRIPGGHWLHWEDPPNVSRLLHDWVVRFDKNLNIETDEIYDDDEEVDLLVKKS